MRIGSLTWAITIGHRELPVDLVRSHGIIGRSVRTVQVRYREDTQDFVIGLVMFGATPDAGGCFDSGFEMLDELGHRYPYVVRRLAEPL